MKTLLNYLKEIRKPIFKPIFKVELLRPDETIMQEITQDIENTSGSININFQNGARRSCSIVINNPISNYTISPSSLWINQKFKVYTGLQFSDGENIWFSQGVFVLKDPNITSNFSEHKITLERS